MKTKLQITLLPFFLCWISLSAQNVTSLKGLAPNETLKVLSTQKDQLGFTHTRMSQMVNGIPVFGGMIITHEKGGELISRSGHLFPVDETNNTPSVSEQEAYQKAISLLPNADFSRTNIGTPRTAGTLIYIPQNGKLFDEPFKLAWKFDLYSLRPLFHEEVFIDALDGHLLFRHNLIQTTDVTGTGMTKYYGTKSIVADSAGLDSFLLIDGNRNIQTLNLMTGFNRALAVDFRDSDNVWNNVNPQQDEVATDVHWASEMTYDYWMNTFSRDSWDGNGIQMKAYVHCDVQMNNAFFDGTGAFFGDGDTTTPWTTLDIVAHEWAHGVTGSTAMLFYYDEFGALNESFSDIFGACVEFYADSANFDYLCSEDMFPIRNMADPNQFDCADTYYGDYWILDTSYFDNGGVHFNSGVQNFWFAILTEGFSGINDNGDTYNVSGVGIDTSAAIAYRNLSVYLTPSSEFYDARQGSLQAAEDLYGPCSNAFKQTMNAWHAVGVGGAYASAPTAAFTADPTTSCLGTTLVTFSSQSSGDFIYFWDFGDGDTVSGLNPEHTYHGSGSYTVTLIVTACDGTMDTLVMPDYIVIDTDQPCIITLPHNDNILQTGCAGTFYDSGGDTLNYLNNNVSTITITPSSIVPVLVRLDFISFDMMTAGDYIAVYDGPTTSDSLLGNFNGSTLPNGGTITSTGGSITIKETSNGTINKPGFEVNWSCIVGVPEANEDIFEIYPNPASTQITLRFPEMNKGHWTYKITDVFGRNIAAGMLNEEGNIELTHQPAGVYFIETENQTKRMTGRFVKE